MNKLLLGTTALVGASLLMAGPVNAAKPKVKVNGGITVELGVEPMPETERVYRKIRGTAKQASSRTRS